MTLTPEQQVEKVKEEIADDILLSEKVTVFDYQCCIDIATQILSHPDILIRDADQSLPESPTNYPVRKLLGLVAVKWYHKGIAKLLAANFVKVIKEG